ncbi:MAG: cupin domain-containing protein [Actinomycetota bacterium]|nr:cupin domain-containing protein [Actinomycetota bacterium]
MPPVVHRAEVPVREVSEGDIAFARQMLGVAAGSTRIGASVYVVRPDARQMPVHVHADEEEIFYVLSGGGLSWERNRACLVGPGDVIVQPPRGLPHTFLAGDQGLELLAFASGTDTSITYLPRAKTMWCGARWVPVDGPHPFRAEGQAGALARPEPGERPANVIALDAVGIETWPGSEIRRAGAAAGSAKAGLNHVRLQAGAAGAPLHCHALEEELFYVLAGSGRLRLGDDEHPLNEGDVVARPPGTAIAHGLAAGEAGLTYLVYGTRVHGDSVYYPEHGQVRLRGLGVTLDVAAS